MLTSAAVLREKFQYPCKSRFEMLYLQPSCSKNNGTDKKQKEKKGKRMRQPQQEDDDEISENVFREQKAQASKDIRIR